MGISKTQSMYPVILGGSGTFHTRKPRGNDRKRILGIAAGTKRMGLGRVQQYALMASSCSEFLKWLSISGRRQGILNFCSMKFFHTNCVFQILKSSGRQQTLIQQVQKIPKEAKSLTELDNLEYGHCLQEIPALGIHINIPRVQEQGNLMLQDDPLKCNQIGMYSTLRWSEMRSWKEVSLKRQRLQ